MRRRRDEQSTPQVSARDGTFTNTGRGIEVGSRAVQHEKRARMTVVANGAVGCIKPDVLRTFVLKNRNGRTPDPRSESHYENSPADNSQL